MSEMIKIMNHELKVKEYRGQRVITLKDVDTVHERPEGTARKRFNTNRQRFMEGEDCFVLQADEAASEFGIIAPSGLTLITESGYLMLVKSLNDDLAWDVQRQLVNGYFRAKELDLDNISTELKAILLHDKKLQLVENRIDEVDGQIAAVDHDLQTFKLDLPLLGVECDQITSAVKKQGVSCLGGKKAPAYQDASLRARVYQDIYKELKRQFGVASYKAIKRGQAEQAVQVVEAYALPIVLAAEVEAANEQMEIAS